MFSCFKSTETDFFSLMYKRRQTSISPEKDRKFSLSTVEWCFNGKCSFNNEFIQIGVFLFLKVEESIAGMFGFITLNLTFGSELPP